MRKIAGTVCACGTIHIERCQSTCWLWNVFSCIKRKIAKYMLYICVIITGPGVAGYLTAGTTTAHARSTMPDAPPPIDPHE